MVFYIAPQTFRVLLANSTRPRLYQVEFIGELLGSRLWLCIVRFQGFSGSETLVCLLGGLVAGVLTRAIPKPYMGNP